MRGGGGLKGEGERGEGREELWDWEKKVEQIYMSDARALEKRFTRDFSSFDEMSRRTESNEREIARDQES